MMKWFQKVTVISLLSSLLFCMCVHKFSSKSMQKMDPPLRQYILSSDSTPVQFSGICYVEIDQKEKDQMEQIGIEVRTITKNMFTAAGNREQIIELSHKKWIKKLQHSKKVRILED